jgi:DNA replication protein DnaC
MSKALKERVKNLGLKSVVANWQMYEGRDWLVELVEHEEKERERCSLEKRKRDAKIGQFKPMSDFDWEWPEEIDRVQVEELFSFKFYDEKGNVVLIGNNGLGKSMIAQSLAHTALMRGISTRFVKASDMLNELVECDGSTQRRNCLKKYSKVGLLVIDEVGYMNYDNRFADLLYEVISARYQKASTIVTTNKAYSDWGEIFPNAACVVTLVDRLVHKAETVVIKGKSYRQREALEHAEQKAAERRKLRKKGETVATK